MPALKTLESRSTLGYLFHSTHYENLESILRVKELRSLPSLVHDLGLSEEKDFKARSGGSTSNFHKILENPKAELYQGIFTSQNGIGEEASGQYFNEYLPICFAFDFRKLLKGYAVGVNSAKDVVIYGKGEDRKARLPISSAEAMFISSDVYLEDDKIVEPRFRRPYLEEYVRVSMKDVDNLMERFRAVEAISSFLKGKGIYGEVSLRLNELFNSTLERARKKLGDEKKRDYRESIGEEIRSLEKCIPAMARDGVLGLLEMTEGQVDNILDDMATRGKKKFRFLGKEYLQFGGEYSLEEIPDTEHFPIDPTRRCLKRAFGDREEEKEAPDYFRLVKTVAEIGLGESGIPEKPSAAKERRAAAVNDIALILLFATPTKLLGTGSGYFEHEYGEQIARYGPEFKAALESRLDRNDPFTSILVRDGGKALYHGHHQISYNYYDYCHMRGSFEEYLKGSSGRTSTRELLIYLFREKGVKFNATPYGFEIPEHEKAGLPPKIIFFGDKGKEDLPLVVERFLEGNGVKIPQRPHSTYLETKERDEQGLRTIEWLKEHCRPLGRAHATWEKIELFTCP